MNKPLKNSDGRWLAAAVLLVVAVGAGAQNFSIDWFKIAGGGGASTGGVYSVSGTIGQPDAGTMSGGQYSLAGGFWGVVSAMQTPGVPLLSVTQTNGVVTVSWPKPAENWLLDQTAALASPPAAISWGQVSPATCQTSATHIFITVPMPGSNKFYRLRKP